MGVAVGITIALQSGTRVLRVVRLDDCWDVWLAADRTYSVGVFIRMYDNGRMERHHVENEVVNEVFLLRPQTGGQT